MADDDLLARLNALKAPTKTPVAPKPSTGPHPSIRPKNADDDITARFRRLAGGGAAASEGGSAQSRQTAQSKLEDVVSTLPSERIENVEDEQSLDDLLKELGEDQSSWLNQGSEEDRVSNLLKEAKAVLPQQGHENQVHEQEHDSSRKPAQFEVSVEDEQQVKHQDEQDEKDADDYIAQVMADIELQKKNGTYKQDESDTEGDQVEDDKSKVVHKTSDEARFRTAREATPLDDLPSAPSTAPVLAAVSDDDLEARFASLSLPSTPQSKPGTKKPATSSAKAKSNLPTYTDEDIESWCAICNEDATVRCLGCEGDLYCQECWAEGHTGPDAGYDEKRHKAVVYNRGEGRERKRSLAAA